MKKYYCDICHIELEEGEEAVDRGATSILEFAEAHEVCDDCALAAGKVELKKVIRNATIDANLKIPRCAP